MVPACLAGAGNFTETLLCGRMPALPATEPSDDSAATAAAATAAGSCWHEVHSHDCTAQSHATSDDAQQQPQHDGSGSSCIKGEAPGPRGWFAAAAVGGSSLLVHGGLGGDNQRRGDMYLFDLHTC